MIKFLDLNKQYHSIKSEIDMVIQAVIHDSAFIKGKYVETFEAEFAAYQDAKYCVGVGNGTDALEIIIESLGLSDCEIIVPANTFIATAEAVTRTGNHVVFCDCNKDNYTISIEDFENKITPRTKAVIPVHLYGHPCDMDGVMQVAKKHGLMIIEDCAQAHGAEYKGRRVGTIGNAGMFSFYPGKNLGAYGDGGAIVTNDPELEKYCRMLANHGRSDKYNHLFEGRSSRLDGLQAAILSAKLRHLDEWIESRNRIAEFYIENLQACSPLVLPKIENWAKHVYHLFVVRVSQRDKIQTYLKDHEIQTGVHYPIALPDLQAYAYLKQADETICATQFSSQLLSLPIGEHLVMDDAQRVTMTLKEVVLSIK